jgi:hypothetical protein
MCRKIGGLKGDEYDRRDFFLLNHFRDPIP